MRVINSADGSLCVQRRWKGKPHTFIGLAKDLALLFIENMRARFKLIPPGQTD